MTRNLDHRVEIFSPVFDTELKEELRRIIELQLKDNVKTRIINKKLDNSYKQDRKKVRIDAQMKMYRMLEHKG